MDGGTNSGAQCLLSSCGGSKRARSRSGSRESGLQRSCLQGSRSASSPRIIRPATSRSPGSRRVSSPSARWCWCWSAGGRTRRGCGLASLVFDGAVIAAFATLYSFEYGSPTRWALMFVVVEGALRYGLRRGGGGLRCALAVPRLRRVVAGERVRWPVVHLGPGHVPVRRLLDDRADRGLARESSSP